MSFEKDNLRPEARAILQDLYGNLLKLDFHEKVAFYSASIYAEFGNAAETINFLENLKGVMREFENVIAGVKNAHH